MVRVAPGARTSSAEKTPPAAIALIASAKKRIGTGAGPRARSQSSLATIATISTNTMPWIGTPAKSAATVSAVVPSTSAAYARRHEPAPSAPRRRRFTASSR